MERKARNLILLFATLTIVSSSSEGHRYHVGGKGGWIVNPHVRYNHWSDRTRFVVDDSLVFKYEKGGDSVLLVTKDDYYICNTRSPLARWNDGATEVSLNRTGAFFFISGEEEHCRKGQRMIVVVLPWNPQPPISLPPESPAPKPPRSSPAPRAEAPKFPPPTAARPVRPPTQSPGPIGSPSSPVAVPPSSPTISPSPSSYMQIPAAPAPAPAQSSASAVTGAHHILWWVVAGVTILLSAIF